MAPVFVFVVVGRCRSDSFVRQNVLDDGCAYMLSAGELVFTRTFLAESDAAQWMKDFEGCEWSTKIVGV